jgi:hypothetical protein
LTATVNNNNNSQQQQPSLTTYHVELIGKLAFGNAHAKQTIATLFPTLLNPKLVLDYYYYYNNNDSSNDNNDNVNDDNVNVAVFLKTLRACIVNCPSGRALWREPRLFDKMVREIQALYNRNVSSSCFPQQAIFCKCKSTLPPCVPFVSMMTSIHNCFKRLCPCPSQHSNNNIILCYRQKRATKTTTTTTTTTTTILHRRMAKEPRMARRLCKTNRTNAVNGDSNHNSNSNKNRATSFSSSSSSSSSFFSLQQVRSLPSTTPNNNNDNTVATNAVSNNNDNNRYNNNQSKSTKQDAIYRDLQQRITFLEALLMTHHHH